MQDCENCADRLIPENQFAWDLIMEMSPGLFDAFGGVRYEAIEHVFNLYEIPFFQRRELFQKVAVYIEAVREGE